MHDSRFSAQNQRIRALLRLLDEYLGFLVPLYDEMSPEDRERAQQTLASVLSHQPGKNLRLLKVFLHLMNFWCWLRCRRPFRQLNSFEKDKVVRQFFASPFPLVRKGFWGINTLAKLAVYSQESVYPKINYYPMALPKDRL